MKIPKWFYKSGLIKIGHPSIDHVIVIKNDFIEVHSRPYHILQRQIEQIIHICKANNICFEITGETGYENKDTCTFKFWLIEDEKNYEESEVVEKILNKQK